MKLKEQELKNFFFEAAMATYAGRAAKNTILNLPGSKVYTYGHSSSKIQFLYKDVYFVNGLNSGGQTTIFARIDHRYPWVPVWLMQYNGFETSEDKTAISFLKIALTEAYRKKQFNGGRGPRQLSGRSAGITTHNGLWYINKISGDFKEFSGQEEISWGDSLPKVLKKESTLLFRHNYSGRTLIDLE